jgi:hypothetical protein
MMTPDIIQRIQIALPKTFCCNPTITRIEEYAPDALYEGFCDEHCEGDDWDWIERVFRVSFILHDYPGPGQTMESRAILALPKQEFQEINTFIEGEPAPLSVYDIADSTAGATHLLPSGKEGDTLP